MPLFRASVDVVTVDAFAHQDRKPLGDLTARDFVVRDNGVEQVVDSLGTTDSAHVIIGLDLSGSVDGRTLEQLRTGVRALIGELTPQDRVSLFTFSDRVRLLMRAITPGGDLDATLAGFEASGATPLHDAIVFGSALSFADQRPSVFLLFTDGQDTTSWTSAARTLDVLRRTNVVVFPVGAGLPAAVTSAPFSEIFTRQTWMAPTPGRRLAAPAVDGRRHRWRVPAHQQGRTPGRDVPRHPLAVPPALSPDLFAVRCRQRLDGIDLTCDYARAPATSSRAKGTWQGRPRTEDGGRRREDGGRARGPRTKGRTKTKNGTRRTAPGARCRSRK